MFQDRRSLASKGLHSSTAQIFDTWDHWGRVRMLRHFVPSRHRCCLLEVEEEVVVAVVDEEEEKERVKNSY